MAQPRDKEERQMHAAARKRFAVIEGGHPSGRPASTRLPVAPVLSADELAADMAEIFTMSLLRPFALPDLGDPHAELWIDPNTGFTPHELLCELRNLPWWQSDCATTTAEGTAPSRAGQGEPGHRRQLRLNGNGQLTLGTLYRGGVMLPGASAVLSDMWREDHAVNRPDPDGTCPDAAAPLSAWVAWCARESGAGLRLPGQRTGNAGSDTLGQMADALYRCPPARPFHNAALAALARGVPMARGWTGARLFALMQKAETQARRVALAQSVQLDRLPRPAVTAARMSVWLARAERAPAAYAPYRGAANILAEHAPRLLDWIGRANAARRGRATRGPNLFLPLAGAEVLEQSPADCLTHVTVAGALATVLKAVCEDGGEARRPGRADAAGLAKQVDRLVSNISLARTAGGGYFPAENAQDMRLGETLALDLLRADMQRDNRAASVRFTDFDGKPVSLSARQRAFGQGWVALHRSGPKTATAPTRSAPHLTLVV